MPSFAVAQTEKPQCHQTECYTENYRPVKIPTDKLRQNATVLLFVTVAAPGS